MHVNVITLCSAERVHSDVVLRSLCGNRLTVSGVRLASGPPSIDSRVDEAFAIPVKIAAAEQAEKGGADALVIDCVLAPELCSFGKRKS
jgi:Asp/Glu/hydantoin racemase